MKHAVILAHPRPDSFCAAIAKTYAAAARALGHDVLIRDLYAMDFDPRLKASELPREKSGPMQPDVEAERARLRDIDVFVLVYPFWFNAPPAMLKGYIDRVFSMGFGYEPDFGGTSPRLSGRKLISLSTSGAPDLWVRNSGALLTLTAHLDCHLAGMTGLEVADHMHFGGIAAGMSKEDADDIFDQIRAAVRRLFGETGAC